jgi:hypothetical protein
MRTATLFVCIMLFCCFDRGGLLAQQPRIGSAPSWVREYPLRDDGTSAGKDMEDGYVHLLVERQINVAEKTIYRKNILQIETAAGVQNASQISVDYDPSYQRVVFHYIHIIRDGKVINGLMPSGIRTIHQEKDMYKSIYNGTLTAMIFLEDVRKGDRIEYAYSLRGFNKVFGDKYFETLDAGFAVPVTHLYYKLICPAVRTLRFRYSGKVPDPVLSAEGADKVYEWKLDNVPAIDDDDDEPSWYNGNPYIMVSEYRSWKEVNDWALSLFRTDHTPSGELEEKIGRIRATLDSPERRALAALRFVQDDIRYLGIEMGPNTHQPHDPEKVCSQRFGDCKDKALLLVTMLQALGIQAAPVLINADDKDKVRDQLPSPYAFNHATVRMLLNGKYYWLDPTISFQRGSIGHISFPDFKCGLVLTDTTTGLTAIPLQDSGLVVSKELFTLGSLSGPSQLDISTYYTGSFADDIRSDLNSSSLTEMQKSYLQFYGDYYKEVKVRDSLKVEDNEQTGTVVTHEFYTVGKLWQPQSPGRKASFYALLVNSILPKAKDKERTGPFALPYPLHYKEEMEIRLPENWHFEGTPDEIKSSGFLFASTIRSDPRSVHLSYEYRTLKDYVDAGDAKTFYNLNEQVKDALGYELTLDNDDAGEETRSSNTHGMLDVWEAIILAVLCTTVVVMHIRRIKR